MENDNTVLRAREAEDDFRRALKKSQANPIDAITGKPFYTSEERAAAKKAAKAEKKAAKKAARKAAKSAAARWRTGVLSAGGGLQKDAAELERLRAENAVMREALSL